MAVQFLAIASFYFRVSKFISDRSIPSGLSLPFLHLEGLVFFPMAAHKVSNSLAAPALVSTENLQACYFFRSRVSSVNGKNTSLMVGNQALFLMAQNLLDTLYKRSAFAGRLESFVCV